MTERLWADVAADVARAAELLRQGRLVALPTETVYGLGANALDPVAVARIFEAKQRPSFDPLIVHLPDAASLGEVVDLARAPALLTRAAALWPAPLTLVGPRTAQVPDLVTSGLDTVAVRVPAHEVARAVIRAAGVPVAAPSANVFGSVSPTTAEHVLAQLEHRIDAVLDAGPCAVGVESTIVAFGDDGPTVLRHGGMPVEALTPVLGELREGPRVLERPLAPGQLARHYATVTPLRLRTAEGAAFDAAGAALLVVAGAPPAWAAAYGHVEALALDGDLRRAAAGLFAAMRRLDAAGYSAIDVVPCAEQGLGRAIVDRLRRAAVPA